ncbi:protein transport protein Sec31, putative [Trypanosoma brucei brucei TREU927]|uniref:Protein transport protein Sec31, putative n=1 Tax=Trypanosoma brucei brucei (strain 927/4 GUTat10.1) TaxID=185431 RepID=Q385F2_TRYB2|nr:protein transport protein Sec31, putative [Trypanosoma brucei brucei TREU927]EAN79579.1 protein transport protein Sec31, putative [Trypanosoma brucei brucei TREU927]
MRLKATPLTCVFAWAPEVLGTPTFLAAASVAGAIDDNFSGEAFLEIRLVDVTQTDETEMPVLGRTVIPAHALRVDWSPHGGERGIIAVSCEDGAVYVYDASIMMKNYGINPDRNTEEPRLSVIAEHRGAVRGCQFNPSQPTFLAIGGDDGAWDVWMLENPREPQRVPIMPDSAQPAGITHLQWNPKWPHILATSVANGVVNVWNLKTQTLAVSLHVSKSGKSGSSGNIIAWHPSMATQIAVGLDEKHPAIQIWDLKKAMMPLREMLGHENAVTGLAWNMTDHAILASCDADGKTLWWDPSTGERNGALQQQNGYMVDMKWSRALPVVLATSSFEPLFCVSTAEDVSSAPAPGASVQKSLQRPCGASIGISGLVASVSSHSANAVRLTRIVTNNASDPSGMSGGDPVAEISRLPPASVERVEWLKAHQYPLLAAAAACKNDRTPILSYLAEDAPTEDTEDPFETMQGTQKSLEDIAASHVAAGRINEAVEACLDECEFGDAFAIAYLQGGKLMQRVQQEYTRHILMNSQGKRHIVYASAVAAGDFRSLMVGGNALWKEALSVIISFVGERFSEACDKLALALKEAGNRESAMTCFICSGNVDAVAELWHEENMPVEKLVQEVLLLEEVTGRKVTSTFFGDYLYEYGLGLLGKGLLTKAMPIFQRSANVGNRNAAIMVDRMRFEVPCGQITFPFVATPLSDSLSQSCLEFLANKGNGQQQQQQQQPPSAVQPQYQQQRMGATMPPPTQQQQQQQPPSAVQPNMYGGQQQQPPSVVQPQYQQQRMGATMPPPTQQQQQQQPPSAVQPNMYGGQQQQPPSAVQPNMYGGQQQQAPAPGIIAQQPGPAVTANSAAPVPRLMPHPISSWSSLGSVGGGVVTNHPPATATMSGYCGAPPQNLPSQELQGPVPTSAPPRPPNHMDPQRSMPMIPPPSCGSSVTSVQGLHAPAQPTVVPSLPSQQVIGTPLAPPQQFPTPAQPPSGPRGMPLPPRAPSGLDTNPTSTFGAPPTGSLHRTGKSSPSPEPSAPRVGNMMVAPPGSAPPSMTSGGLPPPRMPSDGSNANWNMNPQSVTNQPPQAASMTAPSSVAPPPPGIPSTAVGTAPPVVTAPRVGGVAYAPVANPGAPPRFAAAGGRPADDFGLSSFEISSLNPEHRDLAQKLRTTIQQVANAQRRSAIAKAAMELFQALQTGSLPPDVVGLLSEYINCLGSQRSREMWKELATKHFSAIQHINNLKFLQ